MSNGGKKRLIVDLSRVADTSVPLVRLIVSIIANCQRSKITLRMVGSAELGDKLKAFQETSAISLIGTVEEARASF